MREITIPENVEYLGPQTFLECLALEILIFNTSRLCRIPDGMCMGCTLLRIVDFGQNSRISHVGGRSFSGCSALRSITLPPLTTHIGTFAFASCTNLISVIRRILPKLRWILAHLTIVLRNCAYDRLSFAS